MRDRAVQRMIAEKEGMGWTDLTTGSVLRFMKAATAGTEAAIDGL